MLAVRQRVPALGLPASGLGSENNNENLIGWPIDRLFIIWIELSSLILEGARDQDDSLQRLLYALV